MPLSQSDILYKAVTDIKAGLVASLKTAGRYASGDTEQQITVDRLTDTHIQLTAPWWFYALENGRKPTSPTGPYMDGPTLLSQIQKWIAAKGLNLNAYAVTKNIHKNGYPGKPGVISTPLSDDNIDKVLNPALEAIAVLYSTEVLTGLNLVAA